MINLFLFSKIRTSFIKFVSEFKFVAHANVIAHYIASGWECEHMHGNIASQCLHKLL